MPGNPYENFEDANERSDVLYNVDMAGSLQEIPSEDRYQLSALIYEGFFSGRDDAGAIRGAALSMMHEYGLEFDWNLWREEMGY